MKYYIIFLLAFFFFFNGCSGCKNKDISSSEKVKNKPLVVFYDKSFNKEQLEKNMESLRLPENTTIIACDSKDINTPKNSKIEKSPFSLSAPNPLKERTQFDGYVKILKGRVTYDQKIVVQRLHDNKIIHLYIYKMGEEPERGYYTPNYMATKEKNTEKLLILRYDDCIL